MAKSKRAVVVTTVHKGVFFGYPEGPTTGSQLVLRQARLCVYWTADLHGFMGLAQMGPGSGCRIGPAVDRLELRDITSVMDATPEAIEKWEKGQWA